MYTYPVKNPMNPKALILAHHYTHSWPSGKSVVFSFEDAVIVFSIPANCMVSRWLVGVPNRVWELTRLWAPDGHRPNLLTQAIAHAVREFHKLKLADALISYADPNVGHKGGVYRAASWVYLGQSEESRAYRGPDGQILSRRKFHSGRIGMTKAQICARGFTQLKLPGKERFARALTRTGKRGIANRLRIVSNGP